MSTFGTEAELNFSIGRQKLLKGWINQRVVITCILWPLNILSSNHFRKTLSHNGNALFFNDLHTKFKSFFYCLQQPKTMFAISNSEKKNEKTPLPSTYMKSSENNSTFSNLDHVVHCTRKLCTCSMGYFCQNDMEKCYPCTDKYQY